MGIETISAGCVGNEMQDFTDANCLIAGYKRAEKASGWKESNQRYGINLLKNVRALQKELRGGAYRQDGDHSFNLCEQGHLRLIKALGIKDTVTQQSLCSFVMIPELGRHLIHDNGASQKNKGLSFTRRRFEQHLRWHYQRYGTDGYVLKIDFRKYFDNIRHDVLREEIWKYISDETVRNTIDAIHRANEIDISFSDDPDYIDRVFNSLEYAQMDKKVLTGKRYMAKSLGIGSPIAQIAGIFLPTRIDTYCKTVRGIHCYDAYMDDRIIIHPQKDFLWNLLGDIKDVAAQLGLKINEKKTQIIKLTHGFTFLKTRYILTETGKIIRRSPRDVVTRQRRKMKKLAGFVVDGNMDYDAFCNQYRSWRGDKRRYNARKTLYCMDKTFGRLKEWIHTQSKLREQTIPLKFPG